jgi:hypothetical protein
VGALQIEWPMLLGFGMFILTFGAVLRLWGIWRKRCVVAP